MSKVLFMYISLYVKYQLLILKDFDETWVFSTDNKKNQTSNFLTVRRLGAELFRTDQQTDRQITKLIEAFRNLAIMSKNVGIYLGL
jgi:hypothetical protein